MVLCSKPAYLTVIRQARKTAPSALFFLSLVLALAPLANAKSLTNEKSAVVDFQPQDTTLHSLMTLAASAKVPMGIIEDDTVLRKTKPRSRIWGNSVATVLDQLLLDTPGYFWSLSLDGSGVIEIRSRRKSRTSMIILNTIIDRFRPPYTTSAGLYGWLWISVLAIHVPDMGVAGENLSSTFEPRYDLSLDHSSVEHILNVIATSTKATWILKPVPEKAPWRCGAPPFYGEPWVPIMPPNP